MIKYIIYTLNKIYFVAFQDCLNFSPYIYATPITHPVIIAKVLLINIVFNYGTTNLTGCGINFLSKLLIDLLYNEDKDFLKQAVLKKVLDLQLY